MRGHATLTWIPLAVCKQVRSLRARAHACMAWHGMAWHACTHARHG